MPTIDPWGSVLVQSYEKIIKDFGLQQFDSSMFPQPNRLMRRHVVFSGRDLPVIANCINRKLSFYALSGIMPTGDKIHFGNKMVVENLKYFQDRGAKTYILVADLEASSARDVSLEQAQQRALEFHIPSYIALGLDPKKTLFYFQSENKAVMNKAYEFAKRVTSNEFKAIYGSTEPGRIMAAVTQVADILYPQFDTPMPGVIPVGIDQDPHVRLTRDVVARTTSKYHFVPPSAIYHKYTPSLDGEMKMSKSKPESCIDLPEDIAVGCKRIKGAVSGGRKTLEEHRKLGGEPEKDMVFELLKQHLLEDDTQLDKIYQEYKSGSLTTGELKQIGCDLFTKFMTDFNKKLENAKKNVDKLKFVKFG